MNYYKKYIKYKSKYLNLKNKNNQIGGDVIKTIPNDGRMDGMTLQCFWISILQYLRKNGHRTLTLKELRTQAGLDKNTEHIMFDTYAIDEKGNHFFLEAATRIANMYRINIQVYTAIRSFPFILASDQPKYFFPLGSPNASYRPVKLANFGMIHFELIDDIDGLPFVPLVSYNGKATKINAIPESRRNTYLENSEDTLLLRELEHQLEEINKKYNEDVKNTRELKDLSSQAQQQLIKDYTKDKDSKVLDITNLIEQIKERIKQEELQIKSFILDDKITETLSKKQDASSLIQKKQLLSSNRGSISENLSKEIEIFNLQDILEEQEKYYRSEDIRWAELFTAGSSVEELKPLNKHIEEILKSIEETKKIIEAKKRQLGV